MEQEAGHERLFKKTRLMKLNFQSCKKKLSFNLIVANKIALDRL